MLTDDDIVALLRRETTEAQGYDADVLSSVREQALNYYHGKMVAAPEGRSQIVSHDVADSVNALMAQVMPIFQTTSIEFTPEGEEDEDQAQLESDFVKHMIDKSNGWQILADAAFDGLLIGNGWIKCYVDEQTDVSRESYQGPLEPLQIDMLYQPTAENQTVEITENDDTYTVKRTTITRELKIEPKAPDVMIFRTNSAQHKVQELGFIGERVLYTGDQLKEMGVKQTDIESIPFAHDDNWPASRARDYVYQDRTEQEQAGMQDASRLRECFDCYIQLDINENNETELYHVIYGGAVLISKEPAECIPYATGGAVPMPHRLVGMGMYELMYQVQDAKTHTLRQLMDNLAVANSSRVAALEGMCNLDDLTNGRVNGVVRVKSPDAVIPLPAADISAQAITGLNYLDTVREQRGGASLDLNDADRQLMSSSATAAAGQMANHEKMAGYYCHNLVNTLLANTYRLIHKKLRTEYSGAQSARIRGKWTETDPSQWPERKAITVHPGMTTSEKQSRLVSLTTLISHLEQLAMTHEGVITTKGKIHAAIADWIRAADLGDPESYLVDPDSEEGQQAQQQQAQQAQQQQQEMQQMQQQMMQMQMQLENQKLELDKYKHDSELQYKYYDTNLDAEVEEAKMTSSGVIEMEKLNANVQPETDRRTAGAGG